MHIDFEMKILNRENEIENIKEIISKGDLTVLVPPSEILEKNISISYEISIISKLDGPFIIAKKMETGYDDNYYSLVHHT